MDPNTKNGGEEPIEITEETSGDDIFEQPQTANTPQEASPKKSGSMFFWVVGVVLVVIIALAGWYFFAGNNVPETVGGIFGENSSQIVATVNGENITAALLADRIAREQEAFGSLGLDEAAIRSQALDSLISETLLYQKALEAGIEITDEQVEAELAALRAQFPIEEEFTAALERERLTLDELTERITSQLYISTFVQNELGTIDATISEEEIVAAYNEVAAGQPGAPELDLVREQIRAALTAQKEQGAILTFIENLKAENNIEIKE